MGESWGGAEEAWQGWHWAFFPRKTGQMVRGMGAVPACAPGLPEDQQAGVAVPDTSRAWRQDGPGIVSRCGPGGGCLFEQRLEGLTEPQGVLTAAKAWRADERSQQQEKALFQGRRPALCSS